jgi:hypothetical protein
MERFSIFLMSNILSKLFKKVDRSKRIADLSLPNVGGYETIIPEPEKFVLNILRVFGWNGNLYFDSSSYCYIFEKLNFLMEQLLKVIDSGRMLFLFYMFMSLESISTCKHPLRIIFLEI